MLLGCRQLPRPPLGAEELVSEHEALPCQKPLQKKLGGDLHAFEKKSDSSSHDTSQSEELVKRVTAPPNTTLIDSTMHTVSMIGR